MRLVVQSAVTAAATTPLTHQLGGRPFEVYSMAAALLACVAVRVYVTSVATTREARLTTASVTVLTLLFTAGVVLTFNPAPLYAIMLGTGTGAIGAGLIRIAERKVKRLFDDDHPEVLDDEEAIRRLSERIKELP